MKLKTTTILLAVILALSLFGLTACGGDENKPPIGSDAKYKIVNGDFETGDLSGWTSIGGGKAFAKAGVTDKVFDSAYDNKVSYNKDGAYLFGRYKENETGTLKSSTFEIGGSNFVSFKIGGGENEGLTYLSIVEADTNIELCRFGNLEFNTTNFNTDPKNYREANLVKYYADLSMYSGKKINILAVDNSTANWGFLTMDSFVTYYKEQPNIVDGVKAIDIKPVFTDELGTPNALPNGDFRTKTLEGWQVVGDRDSFKDSHINSESRLSNRANEVNVGILRSSSFKVGGIGLMSFRLGATKNQELTYLSIKKVGTNEEVLRTYSNRWQTKDEESTHLYYADLSKFKGVCLYLEVVDNSRGDWGLVTLEKVVTFFDKLPTNITDEIAINLNNKVNTSYKYTTMRNFINPIIDSIGDFKERTTLKLTFYSTIDGINNTGIAGTTKPLDKGSVLRYNNDGTTFCYTGDIPAMWLRDSSAQVLPYLQFMNMDGDVKNMVKGLLLKQFEQLRRDPYANAFNENGSVFERKFELDSLCYPIWLADQYYSITKDSSIFDNFFVATVNKILETINKELRHNDENYTIPNENDRNSAPLEVNTNCGLVWSGYRPSDDVCYFKYFIPGNMFVAATLERIDSLFTKNNLDPAIATTSKGMAKNLRTAIDTYATYIHPKYGKMYAFEVNGMVNDKNSKEGKLLMDAANIPSLISAPWLGFCAENDEVYQNTRKFCLSLDNPYYYEGSYASGIGDPHDTISHGVNPHPETPVPWHMSIAMQALTTSDLNEVKKCVKYMTDTTGGAYVMHEAFNANDPNNFSREWFTWPCSLYAHTVVTKILDINVLK